MGTSRCPGCTTGERKNNVFGISCFWFKLPFNSWQACQCPGCTTGGRGLICPALALEKLLESCSTAPFEYWLLYLWYIAGSIADMISLFFKLFGWLTVCVATQGFEGGKNAEESSAGGEEQEQRRRRTREGRDESFPGWWWSRWPWWWRWWWSPSRGLLLEMEQCNFKH